MKSTIATIAGVGFLIIISNYFHSIDNNVSSLSHSTNFHQINVPVALVNFSGLSSETINSESPYNRLNVEKEFSEAYPKLKIFKENITGRPSKKSTTHHNFKDPLLRRPSNESTSYDHSTLNYEIYLDILLILLLVWFLNREFEISYRLSFHGNIVAARDKAKMQTMKDQAEVLLHNIIPRHVAEQLKITARYIL